MGITELILGTRGSDLALTQTARVEAELRASHRALEVKQEIIRTLGDKRQDLKLSEFSSAHGEEGVPIIDKGIFIKELETALLDGSIHAAVHSLKDVPTILEGEFEVAAVLPRAPVEDVLVFKGEGRRLDSLPEGATVATSSVRRACQLKKLRPDLDVVDIRGNVPTRLRKLVEGDRRKDEDERVELDAIMLARAGLERLEYDVAGGSFEVAGSRVSIEILDPLEFLPAAGQGAIAIEILSGNDEVRSLLRAIHDEATFQRVRMEREFLAQLGAGCQTPVGIHTRLEGEGESAMLTADAIVFEEEHGEDPEVRPSKSGQVVKTGRVTGPAEDAAGLAAQLIGGLKVVG